MLRMLCGPPWARGAIPLWRMATSCLRQAEFVRQTFSRKHSSLLTFKFCGMHELQEAHGLPTDHAHDQVSISTAPHPLPSPPIPLFVKATQDCRGCMLLLICLRVRLEQHCSLSEARLSTVTVTSTAPPRIPRACMEGL